MAATGAALATAPAWLPRVSLARDPRSSSRDVIVSLYLRGGADGLTMCVPWGDPAYYAARPTLAIPRPDTSLSTRAIDLDGFFGFPKAMAPLMPAYTNGHLLVVHATGLTESNRSHFDAQRQMEVGYVDTSVIATGWLGRHLSTVTPMLPTSRLRGVGIGRGLARSLVGAPLTLPMSNLDNYGLTGYEPTKSQRTLALKEIYAQTTDPLYSAGLNTLETISLLDTIDFAGYTPAPGVAYADETLAQSLKSAAALIKAQVGVEAIAIDVDDWDTHYDQGGTGGRMFDLMSRLANSLAAFYSDMMYGSSPTFVCSIMTEFGRRVEENGSLGTDHGHGGVMMVLGNAVKGRRVMAQWPGLRVEQRFENLDLDITIDYRDILAEIIQQRLGNPNLAAVFPGYTPRFRGILN